MRCPSCNAFMVWVGSQARGGLVCRPCKSEELKARIRKQHEDIAKALKDTEGPVDPDDP